VKLVVSLGQPAPGAKCNVPDVVGQTQAAAQQAIVNANCGLGKVKTQPSNTPKGQVLSQSPSAGTAGKVGTKVSLTVSAGPKCTVPNVVGKTQAAATTAIVNANCSVGKVKMKKSSTVPKGNVISQSPPAGTTKKPGGKVNLKVSRGKH
jgi:serine/threonine-protein kinase